MVSTSSIIQMGHDILCLKQSTVHMIHLPVLPLCCLRTLFLAILHYAFLLVFQFLKHVRENYSALQIREIFLDILCYNTCNSLMKACLRCLNCSNEFVHSIVTKMSHLNNFVPCEIYNRKQFVSHHSLSHFSDQSSKKSMHYC